MNQNIGIYILQSKSMSILIPKRKGVGYCKSVFGWHSSNKNSRLFDEIKPDWFCGDTCDIDGYLQIDIKLNQWDSKYDDGLKLTLDCLKQIFTFIYEFKEDDETFWNVVIKK